jgi:hypothetical protein
MRLFKKVATVIVALCSAGVALSGLLLALAAMTPEQVKSGLAIWVDYAFGDVPLWATLSNSNTIALGAAGVVIGCAGMILAKAKLEAITVQQAASIAQTDPVSLRRQSVALFLEFSHATLPADVADKRDVYHLDLGIPHERHDEIGLARTFNSAPFGEPTDRRLFPLLGQRAKVVNYADEPVFDVLIDIEARYFSASQVFIRPQSDEDLIYAQTCFLNIPKIDPGAESAFVFYVVNRGENQIELRVADTAQVKTLASDESISVKVRSTMFGSVRFFRRCQLSRGMTVRSAIV